MFLLIKKQQTQNLFSNLSRLRSLESLDLQAAHISITDESLKVLEKSLQELKSLKYLFLESLSARQVTDQGGMALAGGIGCLHALKYLRLKFRENASLTDQTLNKFSEIFQNLVSLCSVELRFSDCEGMKNFQNLFKSLKEMKSLKEVRLWLPDSDCSERIRRDLDPTKFTDVHFALRRASI